MSDASPNKSVKKVVLAYSGGLDTSIILKWLQTTYGCEVVTFTADLGQGEELEPARKKAEMAGVKPVPHDVPPADDLSPVRQRTGPFFVGGGFPNIRSH